MITDVTPSTFSPGLEITIAGTFTAGSYDVYLTDGVDAFLIGGYITAGTDIIITVGVDPMLPADGTYDLYVNGPTDGVPADITWGTPITVSGGGGGALESVTLPVELHVIEVQSMLPIVGLYNTEYDIPGWQWDRRRVEEIGRSAAHYEDYLWSHDVGLLDGTQDQYWQSGDAGDLKYDSLTTKYIGDHSSWTPVVTVDEYTSYSNEYRLYSDYSIVNNISQASSQDGLMYKDLEDGYIESTISVNIYKRINGRAVPWYAFKHVPEFTGEIDEVNHVRLDAQDGVNITFADLATRKKEYTIINDRLWLNDIYTVDRVFALDAYNSVPNVDFIESHGPGVLTGRTLYTEYFPLDTGSVKLWVGDPLVEWTEVETLADSTAADNHYTVDYDLGIITIGGYQAPNVFLKSNISAVTRNIEVYVEPNGLETYPSSGVIVIDGEQIFYDELSDRGFANCTRGYNSTTAAAHSIGALIEHVQQGNGTEDELYLEYVAIPRLEYECTSDVKRTTNHNGWLNIRPSRNVETTNILQLYPGIIDVASIVLETNKPLIGSNIYGPVYYGTDGAEMIATVYDSYNNPVEDIDVTISLVNESTGTINGHSSYTNNSNSLGQIYATYTHPFIRSNIEHVASSTAHSSGDTVLTFDNIGTNVSVDDIWIFQILKHDHYIGNPGISFSILNEGAALPPYGEYYYEVDGILDESYRNGVLKVTVSSVVYYRTITFLERYASGDGTQNTRIYVDTPVAGAVGETCYVLQEQATEFDSTILNGVRYIVYEWSTDYQHPITGDPGAYAPLKPDSISGNTLIFSGREMPIPDPEDPSVNIAAYVAIIPNREVLEATAINPVTGTLVTSNQIRLDVRLSNYFIGVDSSEVLPIPHGWKLISEESNIGAGIGGANFITINPSVSGIAQIPIMLEM